MIYKTTNINKQKIYFIYSKEGKIKPVIIDRIYENDDELDYYILYYVKETNDDGEVKQDSKESVSVILYETKEELLNSIKPNKKR